MQLGLSLSLTGQRAGSGSTITIDTAPSISGTGEVGQTLTRTAGSYSGTGSVVVSNGRWQRNGVDISPAETSATYTVVEADAGTSIRWAELATDDGSSRTVGSNSIAIAADDVARFDSTAITFDSNTRTFDEAA